MGQYCQESGKNGARLIVDHPHFGASTRSSLTVGLYYNDYNWEPKVFQVPQVILNCDACPPLVVKNYVQFKPNEVVTLDMASFVTGGIKPYSVHIQNPPTGLRQDGNLLVGRQASGSYISNFYVKDSCVSAKNSATVNFRFDAKDPTPPKLTEVIITPPSISASGGEVVFKVTASDNKAISEVNSAVSRPGWSQRVYLTRISGNEISGIWQGSYKVPANTSHQDISYTVDFYAGDNEGNKAKISGAFVVKGDPAGSTMQKGYSIQGN